MTAQELRAAPKGFKEYPPGTRTVECLHSYGVGRPVRSLTFRLEPLEDNPTVRGGICPECDTGAYAFLSETEKATAPADPCDCVKNFQKFY